MLVSVVFICLSLVSLYWFWFRSLESNGESIAYGFRLPLDGSWAISQDFARWNSIWCGYHLAEDVGRTSEDPVYAAGDGVVKFAALAQLGYGYVVIIEHMLPPEDSTGEYVCTIYGHLREENLTSLGHVSKGELIGYLSKNPDHNGGFLHLHFGIRKGRYVETVKDPRRGGWYYGGYTTVFGECDRDDSVHLEILGEWLNPTTDVSNGEGFISARAEG
ncbi:MAG: M23 family metallopeptidase [Candidatus Bathyarchaeota archaeon]